MFCVAAAYSVHNIKYTEKEASTKDCPTIIPRLHSCSLNEAFKVYLDDIVPACGNEFQDQKLWGGAYGTKSLK